MRRIIGSGNLINFLHVGLAMWLLTCIVVISMNQTTCFFDLNITKEFIKIYIILIAQWHLKKNQMDRVDHIY